ncbi:flagellar assembly protein FliW [Paenibacillus kobensis]|uniref:flagellar assembly protein FliW n=1 Tax=Paenibacillus kobensis TaxID=59841 RepID=UPI000FDC1EA2|nr:flagellar assembly protein FliW [Paenibacillus kobensis]
MDFRMLKNISFDFGSSIVGFEHLRHFRIDEVEEGSLFGMMVSEEEPEIGFIVVSPFEMYSDYEFRLSDEIIEGLQVQSPDEVTVLSIVTVNKPFPSSTINLVAPVVINVSREVGRQFILNNSPYTIRAPLFPERNGGE